MLDKGTLNKENRTIESERGKNTDVRQPGIKHRLLSLTLLLILFISAIHLPAQTVDSLKRALGSAASDTSKVNVLNALSWEYRALNADSALYFGNEALNLARKIDFPKGEAMAKCHMGIAHAFRSDYKDAERLLNESLAFFEEHGEAGGIATACFGLALTYEKWGDFTRSLDRYLQALQIREKTGDRKSEVQILTSIGNLYYYFHDYDNALRYAERALSVNQATDNAAVANTRILCSIGNIYFAREDYRSALDYHQRSLGISRSLNKLYTVIALCNVAHAYLKLGDHLKAKPYVEEALSMVKDLNSVEMTAQVLRHSGWVQSKEDRYGEAIRTYEEALRLARSINSMALIIDCYDEVGRIYALTGNYTKAYQYSERARVLNDSLRSTEISDEIARIQKGHELMKKQSEIDLLFQKNRVKELELAGERNWKYGLMAGSGLLLFLVALAYYGFVTKTRLSRKLNDKYLEVQKQKELIESININLHTQALRASMNPHFIFNALSSIQYLIVSNNTEEAFNYLAKFSTLLRKVLDQGARSTVSIGEEMELLQLYIELEALRFDHTLQYNIDLPDQIREVPIPSMVIQPFVENALIHGLFNKVSDRKLDIRLTREQMKIICEITDNGIGREAALRLKEKRGVFNKSHGMELTRKRIEVQNNIDSRNSNYRIDDLTDETGNPSGTRVTITFDYV